MKFLKLGLVVLAMCVGMSGVQAQVQVGEDPMEKMESKKLETIEIEKIALRGLNTLSANLNTSAQTYNIQNISIDTNSFEGVSLQYADLVQDVIEDQLNKFLNDLQENQTITYTPSDGSMIKLFPGEKVAFIIRKKTIDTTETIEPYAGSLGTFFINIDPNTTLTASDITNEEKDWDLIWYEYLTSHDLFSHAPPLRSEYGKYGITPPEDFLNGKNRNKAIKELAKKVTNSGGASITNDDIDNILAFDKIVEQMNLLLEKYLAAEEWDTHSGRDAIALKKGSLLDIFKTDLEPIIDGLKGISTTLSTLTALKEANTTWSGHAKTLELYYPFPPVSNGSILAGPPRGDSGYKYVMERFIPKYVNGAISFLLGFGVLFLILGGITYLISSGDQDLLKKAKDTIIWSIVACVLASLAWVFVNFIISIDFYK